MPDNVAMLILFGMCLLAFLAFVYMIAECQIAALIGSVSV
jgi:hypothetical protein